ncbi:hypothetical protein H5410_009143, partial [Solanum commersonii]
MFLRLLLYFVKMMDFYLSQYEMQSGTGTENLKNQDTILSVTSGVLHFIGESLVPDTIDKNFLKGAKVLQQVDKKFIPIVASTTPAIIDQSLLVMFFTTNQFKVLHSLKESLPRITLVHPSVSFKIADIESEDDLVCTNASPSPLPQLSNINSRFVSKGPIHKLLNNIAMSFHSSCDIEKRSRSQIYPLFLLNLNCLRSLYDSTLEPSKTSVEFK